jgi:hypothetical protein
MGAAAASKPFRLLATAALALSVASCGDSGIEVVQGFHGYSWGTELSQIPELAGSPRVDLGEGLVIHTAEVKLLGRDALAGFYFHPRTDRLIEGVYVMPITLDECEREWARFESDLRASYPGLIEELSVPRRPAADSARYVSDCEYFVYNYERSPWFINLENPASPHDRAGARMSVQGRSLQLQIFYRGREGQEWAEDPGPGKPLEPGAPRPQGPPPVPARGSTFGRA